MAKPSAKNPPRAGSDEAGDKQRELQREQDSKDQQNKEQKGGQSGGEKAAKAVQAGVREEPQPPLPAQHLAKPGIEAQMALRPRFDAPDYRGSGKLEGMTALITGGDSGIGRAVAVLYAREGADVAIVYLSEHEDAEKTKQFVEAEG
ncbi:MAG TPA: SDR family NAD(P)-dependent oxidoreductase, partial [Ramlibacter sp.]|nr:SDR family NAD(P)-dependent oxidoreductase [Ramlibacter sp.]